MGKLVGLAASGVYWVAVVELVVAIAKIETG